MSFSSVRCLPCPEIEPLPHIKWRARPPCLPCPRCRSACRHGDRCSRLHNRPTISPTLLLQNMYQNPILNAPLGSDGLPMPVDPKKVQEFFEVRLAPGPRSSSAAAVLIRAVL